MTNFKGKTILLRNTLKNRQGFGLKKNSLMQVYDLTINKLTQRKWICIMKKWIFLIILILPVTSHALNWNRYFRRMDTVRYSRFDIDDFLVSIGGKKYSKENTEINRIALMKALSSNKLDVKAKSIIVISELGLKGFIDKLLSMLKTVDHRTLKKLVIWGIGSIGSDKHVLALIQYSHKISDQVILNTLSLAIGKIARRGGSVNPLIHLVKNSESFLVKSSALLSLGKIRAKRALPLVISKVKSNVKEVRFCAAIAMAHIVEPNEEEYRSSIYRWAKKESSYYVRAALYFAILKIYGWDQEVYKALLKFLKIPGVSSAAMDFLSALPFRQGIKYLNWAYNISNNRRVKSRIMFVKYKLKSLFKRSINNAKKNVEQS